MTYIDLMLAWDMMAGLGGLKISHLSTIRLFLEDGAETASLNFSLAAQELLAVSCVFLLDALAVDADLLLQLHGLAVAEVKMHRGEVHIVCNNLE